MKLPLTLLFSFFFTLVINAQMPVVIELFTSQGCASCPAADRLAVRLATEFKNTNENIIFLSFHVDYWNRQGYIDPYSKNDFTARQRSYVSPLNETSYYTPQAVINGRIEILASNEKKLRNEIKKTNSSSYIKLIESIQATLVSKNKIKINYKLSKTDIDNRIYIVYVFDKVQTKIGRGENSGLTLDESNVVSQLTTATNSLEGESYIYTKDNINPGNSHIVIFIQKHSTMEIVDAVQLRIKDER